MSAYSPSEVVTPIIRFSIHSVGTSPASQKSSSPSISLNSSRSFGSLRKRARVSRKQTSFCDEAYRTRYVASGSSKRLPKVPSGPAAAESGTAPSIRLAPRPIDRASGSQKMNYPPAKNARAAPKISGPTRSKSCSRSNRIGTRSLSSGLRPVNQA